MPSDTTTVDISPQAPVVGTDERGQYLTAPYEAPQGYQWRFALLGDAGAAALVDAPGTVFDGGLWTCSLVPGPMAEFVRALGGEVAPLPPHLAQFSALIAGGWRPRDPEPARLYRPSDSKARPLTSAELTTQRELVESGDIPDDVPVAEFLATIADLTVRLATASAERDELDLVSDDICALVDADDLVEAYERLTSYVEGYDRLADIADTAAELVVVQPGEHRVGSGLDAAHLPLEGDERCAECELIELLAAHHREEAP